MVLGPLLSFVFKLITLPGIVLSLILQGVFEELYDVPVVSVNLANLSKQELEDELDLDELTDEEFAEFEGALGETEDDTTTEYIDYMAIESYGTLFKLVLYPFFTSTLIAAAIYAIINLTLTWGSIPFWALAWIGFSLASQSFPNTRPTNALLERSLNDSGLLRFIGIPLAGLSKLMSVLRILWADAVYALVLWYAISLVTGYPTGF